MHIINLIVLVLSLQPVGAADPDLALLEAKTATLYALPPRDHNYKEIKNVILIAEKKWQNRVKLVKQQESGYRDQFSPSYTPNDADAAKDKEAVKKGMDYCQKQCARWEERTTNLLKIENRSQFYKLLILYLDPIQKIETPNPIWQQAATVLDNHMQALFASYYRLIKRENSEEIYKNSYLGVGWLKIGYNSAYRKVERIYNGKELLDQGNTFLQQLAIFDEFKIKFEENEAIKRRYTHFSWLPLYLQNPILYKQDPNQLRDFLAQLIMKVHTSNISQ